MSTKKITFISSYFQKKLNRFNNSSYYNGFSILKASHLNILWYTASFNFQTSFLGNMYSSKYGKWEKKDNFLSKIIFIYLKNCRICRTTLSTRRFEEAQCLRVDEKSYAVDGKGTQANYSSTGEESGYSASEEHFTAAVKDRVIPARTRVRLHQVLDDVEWHGGQPRTDPGETTAD